MFNIRPLFAGLNRSKLDRANTISKFISEYTQREERLRVIAHELGHRTKNLLAVVQAIAHQTGRRSASLKDFQTQFSQRLDGLSRSIDLLVDDDGRGSSIGDLVRSQLEPFGDADGVRIAATGPVVLLNPEATQNIGMALHELATNATKHGALSVPGGGITLHWALGPGDAGKMCFRLIWRERNGPEVMAPKRLGFGHIVLQNLVGPMLQGKVTHEFGAGGVSWTLEVPACAIVMAGPTGNAVDAAWGTNDSRYSPT